MTALSNRCTAQFEMNSILVFSELQIAADVGLSVVGDVIGGSHKFDEFIKFTVLAINLLQLFFKHSIGLRLITQLSVLNTLRAISNV